LYGSPANLNVPPVPATPLQAILGGGTDQNEFLLAQTLNNRATGMSPEEQSLLFLLASRHDQFYSNMSQFSSSPVPTPQSVAGACARELVIEEWRAIAQEYVTAGQCFFKNVLNTATASFSWSQQGVVPVEVAAAQMFTLHHTPVSTVAACSNAQVLGAGFDRSCLVGSFSNSLGTQTDITKLTNAQLQAATQAPLYGLPSVDAYLSALNQQYAGYTGTMFSHLNLGLHMTPAEYAINFGFLSNLLTHQASNRNATQACLNYAQAIGLLSTMQDYMPGGAHQITRVTTMQGLLNQFGNGPSPPSSTMFYANGACP